MEGVEGGGGRMSRRRRLIGVAAMAATVALVAMAALWLAAWPRAGSWPLPGSLPAEAAPLRLEVDVSRRVLELYHDGELVQSYGVAVGTRKHPTPRGRFVIRQMVWNPAWVPPDSRWAWGKKRRAPGDPRNPMQGVKMYFRTPTYYIHGTDDPASIGTAASHGCIRMTRADAEELARRLMEHTGDDRGDAWFRSVRTNRGDSRYVTLSSGVPLVIYD
jgi:lipoprotein-anchoring transpeptidase ErfK/SrfK